MGSAGFHPIIDFITPNSHNQLCTVQKPRRRMCLIYKTIWRSAEIVTDEDGSVKICILAWTLTCQSLKFSKAQLKLDDQDGITYSSQLQIGNGKASDEISTARQEVKNCRMRSSTTEEPRSKSKKDLGKKRIKFLLEAIRIEEQCMRNKRAQIARDARDCKTMEEEEKKKAIDEDESTKKGCGLERSYIP
ncbi:hypothetical protein Tco_0122511 [Tanacetum coccineum]